MKKCILMVLLAGSFSVFAQNRIANNVTRYGPATKNSAAKVMEPSLVRSASLPAANSLKQQQQAARKTGTGIGNQTSAICEAVMGSAGNQFGSAYGPKTNLHYNQDLNTIVFIHRSNDLAGWPNTANILYDISTDGGATWLNDQGPAYYDNANLVRARYPQGGIYNPPGNTVPANAYVNTYGPSTDGVNWTHHYKGSTQVGTTTQVQGTYDFNTVALNAIIPQGGCIIKNTGDVWWSTEGSNGTSYTDTVVLSHGVWNSTTHEYDYTFKKVFAPVCTDIDGFKMYWNCAVIFNDAGTTGYVVVLGNDWVCEFNPQDSAIGIIAYKTTDGGNTWNKIHSPDTKLVDPALLNGGYAYASSTQLDLAMDQDDNIHVTLPIIPFQPGNTVYLGYEFGSYGIFDFTTANDFDWTACLITKPMTYYGDFGISGSATDPQIQEENRAQVSRSWEGSKLCFTWFDTDTAIFGPGLNNFPDARSMCVDLDGGLWTAEVNHTEFSGTFADGSSLFGNVSYYTINDGTNETVPIVIDVMTNNTGSPVNFYFEGCAAMSNYVNTGNCLTVTGSLGLNDVSNNAASFSVSSNYPNPYTGKTSVDVTLAKAGDVTIEISNAIGQVLSTETHQNLHAGINTLTIDGSSLSRGLYFFTVKAGLETVTKTMSVE